LAALPRRGKTFSEEDAVKANELLLWLSARREGSWQQFRAAVEKLHSADNDSDANEITTADEEELPLHQRLRLNLECLAHVEFFAGGCREGWRVAPPMLAVHPVPTGFRAVLCGARSPALRDRVLRVGEKLGCEILDLDGVPEVIRFVADNISALSEAAKQAGIHFQSDAPLAILFHSPPCDQPSRSQKPSEFPVGSDWSIHKFDTTSLTWQKVERPEAEALRFGVLRFHIYFQQRRYFLCWKGMTFEMPRALAIYVLLHRRRHHVLRYNHEAASLSLPAICRPPRLIERSLVLCSGFPPVYNVGTARLTYTDVPLDIARFATQLLRQRLI